MHSASNVYLFLNVHSDALGKFVPSAIFRHSTVLIRSCHRTLSSNGSLFVLRRELGGYSVLAPSSLRKVSLFLFNLATLFDFHELLAFRAQVSRKSLFLLLVSHELSPTVIRDHL